MPEKKISLLKLKKYICQADGYERDMLALLYGTTGIMELENKTDFVEPRKFQELADKTDQKTIKGLVPDSGRVYWFAERNIVRKNSDIGMQDTEMKPAQIPEGKKVLKITPELQSQNTKNINMRKHAVGQLIQDDREMQFPIYYNNKGKLFYQQDVLERRADGKFKQEHSEYVQSKLKSKNYFSTSALASRRKGSVNNHDFFMNSEKLKVEIKKTSDQEQEVLRRGSYKSHASKSSKKLKPQKQESEHPN